MTLVVLYKIRRGAIATYYKGRGKYMTPAEALARAKATLDAQKKGQVIKLHSDGSLAWRNEPSLYRLGKKTVLHDPKGEYQEC